MALDSSAVLKQIDFVFAQVEETRGRAECDDLSDLVADTQLVIASLADAIVRFSPSGSQYSLRAEAILRRHGDHNPHLAWQQLLGILRSLRTAYEQGFLQTIQELVHADVFSDFLEMGRYLLEGHFKDAAAVMVGGVLEEHLRKLCVKNGIATETPRPGGSTKPKMIDAMNADLARAGVYSSGDQKDVTAWAARRNDAAHGHYGNYTEDQVKLMLDGVQNFIVRHPA